jgi:hypothetical protein
MGGSGFKQIERVTRTSELWNPKFVNRQKWLFDLTGWPLFVILGFVLSSVFLDGVSSMLGNVGFRRE